MARLSDTMRFELLRKAADIAIQSASAGVGGDVLASIIEVTYKKMLALGEEELGERD